MSNQFFSKRSFNNHAHNLLHHAYNLKCAAEKICEELDLMVREQSKRTRKSDKKKCDSLPT